MDNVALFGGAHVRKGSGIRCCIHDTFMNMYLYMHVYILYICEFSIFLDIKVCGCNSACIYSMVIASWSDIDILATSILK